MSRFSLHENEKPVYFVDEGISFSEGTADELIASGEISTPGAERGSPEFLGAAVREAVEKEIYRAAVIVPSSR